GHSDEAGHHDGHNHGQHAHRELEPQIEVALMQKAELHQISEIRPPLSPSFWTGMLFRSNNVTSRSAKRESCGYFRCWPPLIFPFAWPRIAAGSGSLLCRSLLLMLLPKRIVEWSSTVPSASFAFDSRSMNFANTSV